MRNVIWALDKLFQLDSHKRCHVTDPSVISIRRCPDVSTLRCTYTACLHITAVSGTRETQRCNRSIRTDHSFNGSQVMWNALRNCGFASASLRSLQTLRQGTISRECVLGQERNAVWVSVLGGAGVWLKMGLLGNLVLYCACRQYNKGTHRPKILYLYCCPYKVDQKYTQFQNICFYCCRCWRHTQRFTWTHSREFVVLRVASAYTPKGTHL